MFTVKDAATHTGELQWNSTAAAAAAKFIFRNFLWHRSIIEFVMIYCERSVQKIVGKTEKWTEKTKRARASAYRDEKRHTIPVCIRTKVADIGPRVSARAPKR